jgi:hypothetical protein
MQAPVTLKPLLQTRLTLKVKGEARRVTLVGHIERMVRKMKNAFIGLQNMQKEKEN